MRFSLILLGMLLVTPGSAQDQSEEREPLTHELLTELANAPDEPPRVIGEFEVEVLHRQIRVYEPVHYEPWRAVTAETQIVGFSRYFLYSSPSTGSYSPMNASLEGEIVIRWFRNKPRILLSTGDWKAYLGYVSGDYFYEVRDYDGRHHLLFADLEVETLRHKDCYFEVSRTSLEFDCVIDAGLRDVVDSDFNTIDSQMRLRIKGELGDRVAVPKG